VIDDVVSSIGVARGTIDLMVDYRGRGMSLAVDDGHIPYISEWRRLIAASGTFPRSLATMPLHVWHPIPRTCLRTYLAGISANLSRKPVYSDYTIRDTGAPPDFGEASVNLRYATNDVWQVQLGGKVKDGASGEIHGVCAELVSGPYFDGQDFSSGDSEIARVADPGPDVGPGNSTQWLQWCVNHHIEKVVGQVSGA
jgi:Beta protein